MKKVKFVKVKLINSNLQDYDELMANEIHSIFPIKDKKGEEHLLINFYDDEFCMDASLICDNVEFINIYEEDND